MVDANANAMYAIHAAYTESPHDLHVTDIEYVVSTLRNSARPEIRINIMSGSIEITNLECAVEQREVAYLLVCLLSVADIRDAKVQLSSYGASYHMPIPEKGCIQLVSISDIMKRVVPDSTFNVLYVTKDSKVLADNEGKMHCMDLNSLMRDDGTLQSPQNILHALENLKLGIFDKIYAASSSLLHSATGVVALVSAGCKEISLCCDAIEKDSLEETISLAQDVVHCSDDGSFDVTPQSSPYKPSPQMRRPTSKFYADETRKVSWNANSGAAERLRDDAFWEDETGFQYFCMPQPLSKALFLEISRTIYCYASFVLAPLGFPEFIRQRYTMGEFRLATQSLIHDIIEVCSDLAYITYSVDEASMALSVHKWTEELKDKDCIGVVQAIGLLPDMLYDPPKFVEVPNCLDMTTTENLLNSISDKIYCNLRRTCMWAFELDIGEYALQVPSEVEGQVKKCYDHQWSCMYPCVTYSLLFLPHKLHTNKKKLSSLQSKTFIRTVAEAVQDVLSSEEAFSMIQLQAMVDSLWNGSHVPRKWREEAKYTSYIMIHTLSSMLKRDDVDSDHSEEYRGNLDLADAQLQVGNHDEASTLYSLVLLHLPTYHLKACHPLIGKAKCIFKKGDVSRAVELCRIVQRIDPFYDEAYECLGSINEEQSHAENAMQNYVTAFILSGSRSILLVDSIDRVSKTIGRVEARPIFDEMVKNHRLPSQWLVESYFEGFAYDADYVIALPDDIKAHLSAPRDTLDGDLLFYRAIHHKRNKAYIMANDDIEAVVSSNLPDNLMAIALNLRASFLYVAGDVHAALDVIDRSLMVNPRSTNSLIKKAGFLAELSDFASASELYNVALDIDPTNTDIYLHRGQSAVLQDDFAKAVEWLRKAIARSTTLPITHIIYGIALYRHGCKNQANDVFAEASAMFNESAEVHLFYGEILSDQGNYSDAMRHFLRAFELSPQCPLPFLNAGRVYVATNDPHRAIAHFEQALKIDSRCSSAHLDIAQVFFAQGRTSEAFDHYDRAIQSCRFLPEIEEACASKAIADMQLKATEYLGVDLRQIMRQK